MSSGVCVGISDPKPVAYTMMHLITGHDHPLLTTLSRFSLSPSLISSDYLGRD